MKYIVAFFFAGLALVMTPATVHAETLGEGIKGRCNAWADTARLPSDRGMAFAECNLIEQSARLALLRELDALDPDDTLKVQWAKACIDGRDTSSLMAYTDIMICIQKVFPPRKIPLFPE